MSYIWQSSCWPNFTYAKDEVAKALELLYSEKQTTDIAYSIFDIELKKQIAARCLTEDIVASLSIEGETINIDSLYSSVAKHLDIAFTGKESSYSKSIT